MNVTYEHAAARAKVRLARGGTATLVYVPRAVEDRGPGRATKGAKIKVVLATGRYIPVEPDDIIAIWWDDRWITAEEQAHTAEARERRAHASERRHNLTIENRCLDGIRHVHPWLPKCSCGWVGVPRRRKAEASEQYRMHVSSLDSQSRSFKGLSRRKSGWQPVTPPDQLPESLRTGMNPATDDVHDPEAPPRDHRKDHQ